MLIDIAVGDADGVAAMLRVSEMEGAGDDDEVLEGLSTGLQDGKMHGERLGAAVFDALAFAVGDDEGDPLDDVLVVTLAVAAEDDEGEPLASVLPETLAVAAGVDEGELLAAALFVAALDLDGEGDWDNEDSTQAVEPVPVVTNP